ncbi:hypothetical protein BT69DRAFT_1285467 [Atractiella rhizophila]|nr:hypothetical protein BT69DRAFT_1285467 [Atractiella rhizophila]
MPSLFPLASSGFSVGLWSFTLPSSFASLLDLAIIFLLKHCIVRHDINGQIKWCEEKIPRRVVVENEEGREEEDMMSGSVGHSLVLWTGEGYHRLVSLSIGPYRREGTLAEPIVE